MKTKSVTMMAMLIALNLVLSYVVKIPTGTGFVSLVEVGIVLAAWLFGQRAGLIVGGLTGFLLDLMAGYPQWMLFSLVIHGTEGWLFGRFGSKWLAAISGLVVMVVGYWLAGAFLLSVMAGGKMALGAALIASLSGVFGNVMQVLVGLLVARLLINPLEKILNK